MIRLIPFLTSLINPEMVYRIDRAGDTVTFTLLVGATPPANLLTEAFVFADETTAIAALNDFIGEATTLSLEETICCATSGMLGNADVTKGALSNINLGDNDARTEVLAKIVVNAAQKIIVEYEAI